MRVGSGFGSLFLFYLVLCLQGVSKISSGLKDTCAAGKRVGALMKIGEKGLVLRLYQVVLVLRQSNKINL